MPAEKDEGGDVPAHDKYPDSYPNQRRTYKVYITKVFWCEVQRINPISFHERAVDGAEKYSPENK